MSEYATVWGLIIMLMFYCVPMLKRMDELENRIAEMQKQLENIEKALYVMPDKGDADADSD